MVWQRMRANLGFRAKRICDALQKPNSEIKVKLYALSLSDSITIYDYMTLAYKAVLRMTRNSFSICKVNFRFRSIKSIQKKPFLIFA